MCALPVTVDTEGVMCDVRSSQCEYYAREYAVLPRPVLTILEPHSPRCLARGRRNRLHDPTLYDVVYLVEADMLLFFLVLF